MCCSHSIDRAMILINHNPSLYYVYLDIAYMSYMSYMSWTGEDPPDSNPTSRSPTATLALCTKNRGDCFSLRHELLASRFREVSHNPKKSIGPIWLSVKNHRFAIVFATNNLKENHPKTTFSHYVGIIGLNKKWIAITKQRALKIDPLGFQWSSQHGQLRSAWSYVFFKGVDSLKSLDKQTVALFEHAQMLHVWYIYHYLPTFRSFMGFLCR